MACKKCAERRKRIKQKVKAKIAALNKLRRDHGNSK
jgi:hypothetical protein